MRAAVVTRFGGPDVIEVRDWPAPEPGAGEVLVEVRVADLGFVETAIRQGLHGEFFDVEAPYVSGSALGGVVRAVGTGVDDGLLGAAVVGRVNGFGAHAELAVLSAEALAVVPDGLKLETAVAVFGDGYTALLLEELAPDLAGKKVLVTAAAGGMGLLLVQLARRAGAQVVGAARGEAKLALVKAAGADQVVDYSEPGWEKRAGEVDVLFEGAGGELGATAIGVVRGGGWISAHGAPSGGFAPYDEENVKRRGLTVKGIMELRAGSTTVTLDHVLARAHAGELVPVIDREFALAELPFAHQAMEDRALLGKALIRIQ